MTRAEAAALLGVSPDADTASVQHAFLRLARQVHPDTLPDADEGDRRAAGERFDLLARARSVLLAPPVTEPRDGDVRSSSRRSQDGPVLRPVPGRGLGGSLVVLVLLAFLLVALVTVDDAFRTHAFDPPAGSVPPAVSATP